MNKEKIEALSKLVHLTVDSPEEVLYLQKLEKLALQLPNEQLCADVYYGLSRHYYNKQMSDSLFYWAEKGKAFAKEHELHDTYFKIQNLVSLMYYVDYRWETAMDKAVDMCKEAEKLNNPTGRALGIEVIGLIYTGLGNFDEAKTLFIEGLQISEKASPLIRLDILIDLLLNAFKRDDFATAKDCISEVRLILNNFDDSTSSLGGILNKQLRETELDCYEAYLYAHLQKNNKARKFLSRVDSMIVQVQHPYIDYYYHLATSCYYKSLGKYEEALTSIDGALKVDTDPSVIVEKANIYSLKGDYRKAAELYRRGYQIADSIAAITAVDRVNRINMRYEMNSLAMYAKELEIQKRERIIAVVLFSLAILTILLVVLVIVLIRTRNLKSELEKSEQTLLKEKGALIETHEKLDKAREEAENAREEAVKASKAKSAFLANMSHEIRTPLNSIVGFADVLSSSLTGDNLTYLTVMKKNAYLLLNLINDVLDLSRCDSGKMLFNFVMYDVKSCCDEVFVSISTLLNAGVEMKLECERESLILYTDPIRFQQVITNLMTNAAKFTKSGTIVLAIEVDKPKKVARFIITDTGCGIPKEKQDKIFERFEKLNEFSQGTGLGLSICRVISENLGGRVELDTSYKGGARFIFTHPLP
ncbi:tetratricopeptide repeat-containing sensor histidine kinase [Phocaeicola sp.]